MTKAINLEAEFEKDLAAKMLGGLIIMIGRRPSEANDLEALGMIALRLLFGAGALQGPLLVEKALDEAARRDLSLPMTMVRHELERMYLADEDNPTTGVSFHTVH